MEPQFRDNVHQHLSELRAGLIAQLTPPELGRERSDSLQALFVRACRPEKVDAVGPIGPVLTGEELFDEALALLQPAR